MSYPLHEIRPLAEKIAAELQPHCEKIEIAGSIRRQRPYCNDIDLVVLPKDHASLHALKERCKSKCDVVIDGEQNLIVRTRIGAHGVTRPTVYGGGVQIDVFIAERPSADLFTSKATNYGSLMVCRTGSIAHNIFLVERAKRMGLSWNPYWGVFSNQSSGISNQGKCIASATEEEIFKALELEWIAPEKRER